MGKYSQQGKPESVSEEESGLVWDEKRGVYRPSDSNDIPKISKGKWTENSIMGWVALIVMFGGFFLIMLWASMSNGYY